MARVRLYGGLNAQARRRAIDEAFLAEAASAVLLMPTRGAARARMEAFLRKGKVPGFWGRPVLTFEDFVTQLLEAERPGFRRLEPVEKRLLLEELLADVSERDEHAAPLDPANRGLVSHVERLAAQLKEAAVEPEDFRRRLAQRRHASPLDSALADVYAAYQEALITGELYDQQGLYWEAHAICERGRPAGLTTVRHVFLDGFDDFTPSEFRLLESLAPHLESMTFACAVSLSQPEDPENGELTERTLARLRQAFGPEIEDLGDGAPSAQSEFAARQIFDQSPGEHGLEALNAEAQGLEANLTMRVYPDPASEFEAVGRRVKQLIVDEGVAPHDIAIVAPRLRGAASAMERQLSEYGVPYRMMHRPPVTESSLGAFLLTLLACAQRWRREEVLDVLMAPWFQSGVEASELLEPAPVLARLAGVIGGRKDWAVGVERLERQRREGWDKDFPSLSDPDASIAALARAIESLDAILNSLPDESTLGGYCEAMEGLLDALPIDGALAALPEAKHRAAELEAYRAVTRLLGRVRLWLTARRRDPAMKLASFTAFLRHAFQSTPYARTPGQPTGVMVSDPEGIRQLRFSYVFYVGLTEDNVPRAEPANALFSEEDLQELAGGGLAFDTPAGRSGRERLMFRRVLESGAQVHLSWPAASGEGRAAMPSPYVEDLLLLFPRLKPAALNPALTLPPAAEAASWRELRNIAFGSRERAGLQAMFGDALSREKHGAAVEQSRYGLADFGPYDGVLTDNAIHAELGERFGPRYSFSAGQLEAYAECPFQFFMERVLELRPVETPEARFDARVRGAILHAVLHRFHAEYRGRNCADIPWDEGLARLMELADETFADYAGRSVPVSRGVQAVERRSIRNTLERYFRIQRNDEKNAPWKPAHFEVAFGHVRERSGDALQTSEPYRVQLDGAGAIQFAGIIDRVDLRNGHEARIVDYKNTIRALKRDVEAGVSLQLTLYMMALEDHLAPSYECHSAIFLEIGTNKNPLECLREGTRKIDPRELAHKRRQTALLSMDECVQGIRAGRFPPNPHAGAPCHFCANRRPCRFEPHRIQQKMTAQALDGDEAPSSGEEDV
ncbi:MAG: PD-(D/E)XK nuclease family protein [Candidatus Hydrogenedentota bacterium]